MGSEVPELRIVESEAIAFLKSEPDAEYDLIYIDPPFNTGQRQVSSRDSKFSYEDAYARLEYHDLLHNSFEQAHRLLKETGSIYVHLDHHSVFMAKALLDLRFGESNFLNHIVWSYNYGGRGRTCWPKKHDDILFYAKEAGKHHFDWEAIDRIPYKTPELQYVGRSKEEAEERIARGQVPTDVWEMSIVGTNSKERTGYPTQKPRALVRRMILASCPSDGHVLDFFAGSGTTGAAAIELNRRCTLVDQNPQAIEVMRKRFELSTEAE